MQSSRPVPEAAAAVGDILNSSEYKDIQLEACPCGAAAGLGSAEHPGGCSGGTAACVFTAEPPKLLRLSHLYQTQLAATQGTLPTLLAWFGWAELALSAADVGEPALLLVLRQCP